MSFFEGIYNFFEVAWNFFSNFIGSMITIIDVIITGIVTVGTYQTMLPNILAASVGIVVSVGTLKLLLGWGNV